MANAQAILITGCSGRIGTYVAERLGKEYAIIGFDIVKPKLQSIHYFPTDLSSDESVASSLKMVKSQFGGKLASVIHLAAYYSFAGRHPELYDKITVQGTKRLLKGIKQFEPDQFLFSSTQLIYAPSEQRISEDSPIDPQWDYPKSKVKTERELFKEHGDIPLVIMRIAGCYDDACHSIPISNQIQRIYESQFASRVYPGNLSHGAPFIHFEDLTDAIESAVQKRNKLPHQLTLLIGEGETMSYDALQREISKLIYGKEFRTLRIPKWFAKAGAWIEGHTPGMEDSFIKPWMIDRADDNYVLDIAKAYRVLGWRPRHLLRTTLPLMIAFLKKDPIAFYKTNDLATPLWLEKKYGRS